ncbi:hypothetical protein GCM10007916_00630 [Psychromonas marina]|uniref:Transposase n=1 Tax=Psychromonas marina TaxID=88364 RepID=A0ABQ6DW88_9GAMM|nr:hypothetical protein GCM10007916_00630 [Psychromonas marina]
MATILCNFLTRNDKNRSSISKKIWIQVTPSRFCVHSQYSGIDLHSNNSVFSIKDEIGNVITRRKLPNDLSQID